MKLITLALAGLGAVAMAAAGDASAVPPEIGWTNNAQFTYHCERDVYVVQCAVDLGCGTVEECVIRCIDGVAGAYCEPVVAAAGEVVSTADGSKKRATQDSQQVDNVATTLKARYPIPQEDKHYECSKDGASVLICRWGFCSTDYYCKDKKKGSWCHTDCTCCKTGKMSATDAEDEAAGDQDTAEDVQHARSDATVEVREDTKIGCRIGTMKCSATKSLILTCADGQKYAPYKACGRRCCSDDIVPGWAFCSCGPSPHGLDSPVSGRVPVARSDSPTVLDVPNTCTPGSRSCNGQYVVFCSGLGTWYIVQDCGSAASCFATPESDAFCFGKDTSPPKHSGKREPDASPSSDAGKDQSGIEVAGSCDPKNDLRCTCPGSYKCYRQMIFVCTSAKIWTLSAECFPGYCIEGEPGTAFCRGSQSGHPKERISTESLPPVIKDRANTVNVQNRATQTALGCDPKGDRACNCSGTYRCLNQYIIVCSSTGSWTVTAVCNIDSCVEKGIGLPYCVGRTVSGSSQLEEPARPASETTSPHTLDIEKRTINPASNCDPKNSWVCDCPGTYKCLDHYIIVCGASGYWRVSAVCDTQSCLEGPDGQPHCIRRAAHLSNQFEKRASIESLSLSTDVPVPSFEYEPENSTQMAHDDYCPYPGHYYCVDDDVYVCSGDNHFILSARCGESSRCQKRVSGAVFCVPK